MYVICEILNQVGCRDCVNGAVLSNPLREVDSWVLPSTSRVKAKKKVKF